MTHSFHREHDFLIRVASKLFKQHEAFFWPNCPLKQSIDRTLKPTESSAKSAFDDSREYLRVLRNTVDVQGTATGLIRQQILSHCSSGQISKKKGNFYIHNR